MAVSLRPERPHKSPGVLITLSNQLIPSLLQIEAKTRHEIEEKKTQLRQVVGDSYRYANCGVLSPQFECRPVAARPAHPSSPSCPTET